MKKNLLLLLLAFFGIVSASAQVAFTINVDKAANVKVYTQDRSSGAENLFQLVNGNNDLTFDTSNNPLCITAATGAKIVSVDVDGTSKTASGDGIYRIGIAEGTSISITTSGEGAGTEPIVKTQTLYFSVYPLGSIHFITESGEKTIVNQYEYTVPEGKIIIGPENGYQIDNVTNFEGGVTKNDDGTYNVDVRSYTFLNVAVSELGIAFSVDINASSNVLVEALNSDGSVLKSLSLLGSGPYTAKCPYIEGAETQYLQFSPTDGAEIKAIKRIEADGAETNIIFSAYSGWRSAVAEGDNFIIDAVGPEIEFSFYPGNSTYTLDSFSATVAGNVIELSGSETKATVHCGDIVEVTGEKGWSLTSVWLNGARPIVSNGPIQSFCVTASGFAYLYATPLTVAQFYVDNAKAVVVKGLGGNGEEVAIQQDGMNELSNFDNPLNIAAAAGFAITSVALDGNAVSPKADGTYNVVLEAGSTVVVATKELPKALPVTIMVMGDADGLTILHEGNPVAIENGMATVMALPTEYIDIDVKVGYRISEFRSPLNEFTVDEETGAYRVSVAKAGTITVDIEKWVPAEGNVLLTYYPENNFINSQLFSADGQFKFSPVADRMCEVTAGDVLVLSIFSSGYYFKTITINGNPVDIDPKARKFEVTINENTVIEAETYRMGHITVYNSTDPVNHTTIGWLWVNEEGITNLDVPVGETVTIISKPAEGYIMDGFSFVYPESFTAPTEAPFSFTMTEDLVEDGIILQGNFIVDESKPTYVVSGNITLYVIEEDNERVEAAHLYLSKSPDLTDLNDMHTEVRAAEGEEVYLYPFVRDDFSLDYFSMFYHPEIHVTNPYIVKASDVSTVTGRIELAAQVSYLSGLEGVIADGNLSYNRTADVLYAPADVQIYTLSGALVLSAEAGEVSLAQLPAGLYVARSANSSLKIAK